MASLSLRKIKKVYDNTVVAVQAFDPQGQPIEYDLTQA